MATSFNIQNRLAAHYLDTSEDLIVQGIGIANGMKACCIFLPCKNFHFFPG